MDLYTLAEKAHIDIDFLPLRQAESLSIPLDDGCGIAIDPYKVHSQADEYVKLAHELGHCITGAFYNRHTPLDIRQKHENHADKWAILTCITVDELDNAIADGCENIWQLAERFGVTEDFMRKTVCWYVHGNLAADLYF